jgi:hypothetical protein
MENSYETGNGKNSWAAKWNEPLLFAADRSNKMNDYEYCRRIIATATGDNLERCSAAFRNMSNSELDQEYGTSGHTCREILQGYKDDRERNKGALEWFNRANHANAISPERGGWIERQTIIDALSRIGQQRDQLLEVVHLAADYFHDFAEHDEQETELATKCRRVIAECEEKL